MMNAALSFEEEGAVFRFAGPGGWLWTFCPWSLGRELEDAGACAEGWRVLDNPDAEPFHALVRVALRPEFSAELVEILARCAGELRAGIIRDDTPFRDLYRAAKPCGILEARDEKEDTECYETMTGAILPW